MQLPVAGRYVDGRQGKLLHVMVGHAGDMLVLEAEGTAVAQWPCQDVRLLHAANGNSGPVLGLADGSLARLRIPAAALRAVRDVCPALRKSTAEDRKAWRRIGVWSLAAAAGLALTFFVLLPWAAVVVAEFVPPAYEQRLGQQAAKAAIASFAARKKAVCSKPESDAAMARLIAVLTQNQPARLPLEVTIIDDPMVNAFALPGGQLLIMRGLFGFVRSDAELAAVLAHEIAHVDARHNLAGAVQASAGGLLIGFIFGDVVGGLGAASVANYLLNAGYSRDTENEADRAAALRLQKAGINPAVAKAFFERLARVEGHIPALLNTHPPSPDRAAVFADSGQPLRPVLERRDWWQLVDACFRR